jgi:DNA-binding NtrC family response regulator
MVERVLFVDDDDDLREVMQASLRALGVRGVVSAASLHDVESHRDDVLACDIAVIDINLGTNEPSGLDVHAWLAQHGFKGRTVFLTGHGSNDPRVREAASLAGSRLASKPISVSELRVLLDGATPR